MGKDPRQLPRCHEWLGGWFGHPIRPCVEHAGMLDLYLSSGAPGARQRGREWARLPGSSRHNGNGSSYEFLAATLATRRRALGLTQSQLAGRAGMTPSLISRIESGRQPPTARTLMRLAEALGTSLALDLASQPERNGVTASTTSR